MKKNLEKESNGQLSWLHCGEWRRDGDTVYFLNSFLSTSILCGSFSFPCYFFSLLSVSAFVPTIQRGAQNLITRYGGIFCPLLSFLGPSVGSV